MQGAGGGSHSAELLVKHGRPYGSSAARLGTDVYGYNPYLPGMTPVRAPARALQGAVSRRIRDCGTPLAFVAASLHLAAHRGDHRRRPAGTALVTSSPLIAFPLAVSGNDLPVIGLLCLGLALAAFPGRSPRRIWCAPSGVARPRHRRRRRAEGHRLARRCSSWVCSSSSETAAAPRRDSAPPGAAVLAIVVGPILLIQPRGPRHEHDRVPRSA